MVPSEVSRQFSEGCHGGAALLEHSMAPTVPARPCCCADPGRGGGLARRVPVSMLLSPRASCQRDCWWGRGREATRPQPRSRERDGAAVLGCGRSHRPHTGQIRCGAGCSEGDRVRAAAPVQGLGEGRAGGREAGTGRGARGGLRRQRPCGLSRWCAAPDHRGRQACSVGAAVCAPGIVCGGSFPLTSPQRPHRFLKGGAGAWTGWFSSPRIGAGD